MKTVNTRNRTKMDYEVTLENVLNVREPLELFEDITQIVRILTNMVRVDQLPLKQEKVEGVTFSLDLLSGLVTIEPQAITFGIELGEIRNPFFDGGFLEELKVIRREMSEFPKIDEPIPQTVSENLTRFIFQEVKNLIPVRMLELQSKRDFWENNYPGQESTPKYILWQNKISVETFKNTPLEVLPESVVHYLGVKFVARTNAADLVNLDNLCTARPPQMDDSLKPLEPYFEKLRNDDHKARELYETFFKSKSGLVESDTASRVSDYFLRTLLFVTRGSTNASCQEFRDELLGLLVQNLFD